MRNLVKSKDLCEKCKFTHRPHCKAMNGGRCDDCENLNEENVCLCTTIRINTPCPYFDEMDEN